MQKEILRVENLSKKFPVRKNILAKTRQWIAAASEINFQLFRNETLGLVGESGSGKSTICRLLMSLIKPDKGKIWLENKELTQMSFSQLKPYRKKIQMIFQDPSDSLNPRFTIQELIAEPLVIHKVGDRTSRQKRVAELLNYVGLAKSSLEKYAHEFSGGQKQRVGIARALALAPKLIIADEPVSSLDVSIQAQILNLLKEVQKELQISYLFVSHDLNVIRYMSQKLIVLYLGKIVEMGDSHSIFTRPQHPYTPKKGKKLPLIEILDFSFFFKKICKYLFIILLGTEKFLLFLYAERIKILLKEEWASKTISNFCSLINFLAAKISVIPFFLSNK